MAITISKDLIKAAMERGALNVNNTFRLTPEFVGEYDVVSVQQYKYGRSKTVNGFRIEIKKVGDNTRAVYIPDFHLMRAYILGEAIPEMKVIVDGHPHSGVSYRDDVDDKLTGAETMSLRFSTMDANGEIDTINLPEKIKIAGAVVSKVDDGDNGSHPAIPLRFYKGYNSVLRYHREQTNDAEGFITRDEFKGYLEANAEGKISVPGLPQTIDKLELVNPKLKSQMSAWNHTLLVVDVPTEGN